MHKTQTVKRWFTTGTAAALILTLAACEQLENFEMPFGNRDDTTESATVPLAAGDEAETRDVEAPEVFQKSESGLWDGRPSLGGVWVAHPDVTDPERVIIRNEDNGRFVVGALFRRERDNPGPALQVSSDAAEELGMLAGAPSNLNVVALRREEIPTAAPATTDFDAPLDGIDPVDLAPPAAISSTPLDPIAGAAAAVNAAEQEAALANSLPPLPSAEAPTATPIEPIGAPLNALAPAALADTVSNTDADAPAAAPVAAPASTLEKPFIQIGIFSLEDNANDTAETLRKDGMSASVISGDSQGKPFWRVLVGPAPNAQDRTTILAKIQALGFSDAYFVTN